MKNADRPAHPVSFDPYLDRTVPEDIQGLTKREQIAAMAMQGMLSNPDCGGMSRDAISEESLKQADSLLRHL